MAEPAVSAPAIAPPQADFRVGTVFSRAFSILFENIVGFMLLSGLASLPFLFIYGSVYGDFQGQPTIHRTDTEISAVWDGKQISLFLLGFALTALCQAVVLHGAFQVMRGRPLRMFESISKGLARFLPVVGTVICMLIS